MNDTAPFPLDRPIVDAMRCTIPDDAPIWADEGDAPQTETLGGPQVFTGERRPHVVE